MSEIVEKAEKIVDDISKEVVKLGDRATLTVKLKRCEAKIDGKYRELGRLTYRRLRREEENTADIDGIMTAIDGLIEEKRELRRQIDEIKDKKED